MRTKRTVILSFLPILIAASIIIYYACSLSSASRYDNGVLYNQEKFVAILIIVNSLLVFLNTIIFLVHSYHAAKSTDSDHLEKKDQLKDLIYTIIFYVFNIFTLVISIGIALTYWIKMNFNPDLTWGKLFGTSEYLAIIMFFLFIIADWAIYEQFKISQIANETKLKSKNSGNKTKIKERLATICLSLKHTKKAILLIDVTGFIGITLIVIITHLLEPHHDHIFVEGFAIGAIAFHILFTQMNFALLNYFVKANEI